jgi:hypothetical protein
MGVTRQLVQLLLLVGCACHAPVVFTSLPPQSFNETIICTYFQVLIIAAEATTEVARQSSRTEQAVGGRLGTAPGTHCEHLRADQSETDTRQGQSTL